MEATVLALWWKAVYTIMREECARCYRPLPAGSEAWNAPTHLGPLLIICNDCLIDFRKWWRGDQTGPTCLYFREVRQAQLEDQDGQDES